MGLIDKVNVEVNGSSNLLSTLSTYTTKILKPNIIDGKNILTQAMISSKNTKYVIKYDYEFEEDITIPENCILEFDGGSVNCSNYVITGNKMPTNQIYTPEMFGAGKTSDDTNAIQSCVNLAKNVRMDGTYNVYSHTNNPNYDNPAILVPSNTSIVLYGKISYLTTNLGWYSIFSLLNVSNVFIKGNGKLEGDRLIHIGSSGQEGDHGHGISIQNANNITIEGMEIYNTYGDGIYISWMGSNYDIIIKDVYIHNHYRQGISIGMGHDISILDSTIKGKDETYGQGNSSIDIEEAGNSTISNLTFKNIVCENEFYIVHNDNDIQFDGFLLDNVIAPYFIANDLLNTCVIANCKFDNFIIHSATNNDSFCPCIKSSSIGDIIVSTSALFKRCDIKGCNITDNKKKDFYDCYIKSKGSDLRIPANSTFINCYLSTYESSHLDTRITGGTFINSALELYQNAKGTFQAINCSIIINAGTTSADLIFTLVTAYHCLIKILSTYTAGMYDGRNNYINEGSVVIDIVENQYRPRNYSSGGVFSDAGTIYLNNHVFKGMSIGGANGNFAGFDANGNIVDSGKKPSDFQPAS